MARDRIPIRQDKRARDAKKNQHVSEVKEVRLRPRTDEHDLQVRVRAAQRFVEDGHKVKIEVRFRGREATHPEGALRLSRLDAPNERRLVPWVNEAEARTKAS